MAVHKAIRSNSSAQPQPHHAKSARAGSPKPSRRRPNTQFKAQLFDTFHQLNRGYGLALSALERLQIKTRLEGPAIFPAAGLRDYRNRTEALRAGQPRPAPRTCRTRRSGRNALWEVTVKAASLNGAAFFRDSKKNDERFV
jgi:hypothetical protein